MTELTPRLYVSSYVPPGKVYMLDTNALGFDTLDGLGGDGSAIAISSKDWQCIPGADRERFIDDFTRRSAEKGTVELEKWLAGRAQV